AARVAESVDAPGSVLEGSNPSGGSSPPAGNAEGAFKQLPNKRLKLAGVYRLSGGRCVVPLAGHGLRPTALRRRAGRPQLKRDPLVSPDFPWWRPQGEQRRATRYHPHAGFVSHHRRCLHRNGVVHTSTLAPVWPRSPLGMLLS